jgi:RNA polymerase sigma-70 factor (ECF subfamily)
MPQQDDPRAVVLDLFREHGTAIYRFALALSRQTDDAQDVVQETFLKLLQHVGSGGNLSNVRGWLFTVAANACRDRMRLSSRWMPWLPVHEPIVEASRLPDEDGRLRAARDGLRTLAARDRLLLALRAQGLSYREIAEAASLRPASVGRLLARALDRWERACHAARPAPQAYGRSPS